MVRGSAAIESGTISWTKKCSCIINSESESMCFGSFPFLVIWPSVVEEALMGRKTGLVEWVPVDEGKHFPVCNQSIYFRVKAPFKLGTICS